MRAACIIVDNMCGILCYIHSKDETEISANIEYDTFQWRSLESNIAKRGPDSVVNLSQELNENWRGKFVASVLWMQGLDIVCQPCVDDEGNILLWNGDIFSGPLANDKSSDTLTLLAELKSSNNIVSTVNSIDGPFSIIYFHKSTDTLYFARDKIGRHSLLIKMKQENQSLTLCSVANKNIDNIIELPAIGIFAANLQSCDISLSCYTWRQLNEEQGTTLRKFEQQIQQNIIINASILAPTRIQIQLEPDPELILLFENQLDPKNVDETMRSLLKNIQVRERVITLLDILRTSIKIRLRTTPQYCRNCIIHVIENKMKINCNHPKIGILFSGGLDSTILAVIANEFLPSNEDIDLINVAFEKATTYCGAKKKNISATPNFDVPDRRTGRQALNELRKICPNRTWNFIEVNVSRAELELWCGNRICNLIYPLRTVLDESLGCAIWFASRGSGIISSTNEFYESSCRVLLLGMGADELFGGYTRHRTTLRLNGWAALTRELEADLSRISERNLGRDDRVVGDHGRQSRLPYLDENVIRYVQGLEPWERCYPTKKFPPGLGDKLLLRLVAFEVGLRYTANFPKRALQFGSRIANSKQNANDLSTWLN